MGVLSMFKIVFYPLNHKNLCPHSFYERQFSISGDERFIQALGMSTVVIRKVQVGNDQEKAQSEIPTPKSEVRNSKLTIR